jgi:DNA (cytosine-5)-methyltransferase 1
MEREATGSTQQRERTWGESNPGSDWGKYTPVIQRWELVVNRSAPAPTIVHNDKQRLNPVFVEWMMGLEEGHVTGHGLSFAQELKMLGNGVVPQQARAAVAQLMERIPA